MNILIAMPLLFCLQDPKPERAGSIEFRPPAGWTRQEKTGLWSKEADVLFGWVGVAAASQDPLDKQLAAYLAAKDKKLGAKSLKESPVQALEIASGLKGVCVGREIQSGSTRAFTMDALVVADGKVHAFLFAAPTAEKFQALLEKDIEPMLKELKAAAAAPPPPAGEKQTIDPLKAAGPTKDFGRFCFTMPVPADWKPDEDAKSSCLFTFKAPKRVGDATVEYPVFCQVVLGTLKDARGTLDAWLQRMAVAFTDDAAPEVREIGGFTEFRVKSGGEGATLSMDLGDAKRQPLYRVVGAVLAKDGVVLLMGSGFGLTREWRRLPAEQRQKALVEHKLLEDVGAALTNARCEIPAVHEEATKWLIAKKSYYWKLKWSSASGSGATKSFTTGTSQISWTFHADGTCDMEEKDFSCFSAKMAKPFGGVGPGLLTAGDGDRAGRNRFEVRGKSAKDLWIVVHRRDGLPSFHPMNPSAESTYGDSKPKGLAIDDRIEGDYFSSDDTSDFKDEHQMFWRAWK